MTEVTAKYKLFLAVGMVVTGTLNTISTKERFQFDVRSSHWLKMGSGPVEKCLSSWEPNYGGYSIIKQKAFEGGKSRALICINFQL